MIGISLQEAMGLVAGQLDDGAKDIETTSFRSFDPLLEALYKEYIDARRLCGILLRDRGAHDPMAEIATQRLGSCLTAFEARLSSLRQDMELQRASITRLRTLRARAAVREQERRDAEKAYRRTAQALERNDEENDYANMLILGSMLRQSAAHAYHSLHIAFAFSQASGDQRRCAI